MKNKLALHGGEKTMTRAFPQWPIFGNEEEEALLRVLRSGQWNRLYASEVETFEQAFATYHDATHGIAMTNGTVTLRIALLAAGLQAGDEVIVPPYTFLSTATAVVEANGTPIFVDIEPDTYCLDAGKIEAAITPRTKVIIPVHVGGHTADMDRIMAIARQHNLVVVEDAAHAHGAEYKGRKAGSLGDMASFSFQASKNLNAGEGGIVITNNENYAAMCRSFHNCGRIADGAWYEHRFIGGNYRMTEFQGAILTCQFARMHEQTNIRDQNGAYLNEKLAQIQGITPMNRGTSSTRNSYHLYLFRYNPEEFGGAPREKFLDALTAEGIPCSPGYTVPLYEQPLFVSKAFGPYTGYQNARPELDYATVHCPACERASKAEGCWLPQNVLLGTREDMDAIVAAVQKIHDNSDDLLQ